MALGVITEQGDLGLGFTPLNESEKVIVKEKPVEEPKVDNTTTKEDQEY